MTATASADGLTLNGTFAPWEAVHAAAHQDDRDLSAAYQAILADPVVRPLYVAWTSRLMRESIDRDGRERVAFEERSRRENAADNAAIRAEMHDLRRRCDRDEISADNRNARIAYLRGEMLPE